MPLVDRWCIDGAGSVEWREWGNDFVVYHGDSASTHLLSAAAGSVLQTLLPMREPLALVDLFDRVFGDANGATRAPMSDTEATSLAAILGDFERIGLARRIGA